MSDHRSAFSIDGRTFQFDAPIAEVLPLGGFVEIEAPDGHRYLGQILSERASHRASERPHASGTGMLLATIGPDGTARPLSGAPFGDATLGAAERGLVSSYFEADLGDEAALELGSIRPDVGAPARLKSSGFARHTFMCGQSGSGKTYTMGVVLEQLLAHTRLPMVVLDPNSDYVHLGALVDDDGPAADDGTRSAIRDQADRVVVLGGPDEPLRITFGRLTVQQQLMVLGLDPLADAEEVDVARTIVGEIGAREYTLKELRDRAAMRDGPASHRLRLRIDNVGLARSDIWADQARPPITDRLPEGWRALVFDLGSITRPRDRSIAAAGVVAHLWEQRRERQPVLLVIDEAHNVCPQTPTDRSQALATEHLVAIAGEGRKFGIYLLLATQRPQKVHENVISQCDNLLLMKMNGAADIQQLSTLFSYVPPSLVEMSAGFGLGEGLAAGRISPGPMMFRTGTRHTPEGGADIPTRWARLGDG